MRYAHVPHRTAGPGIHSTRELSQGNVSKGDFACGLLEPWSLLGNYCLPVSIWKHTVVSEAFGATPYYILYPQPFSDFQRDDSQQKCGGGRLGTGEQKRDTAQKSHGVPKCTIAFSLTFPIVTPTKNLIILLSWVWHLIKIHCSEKGRDTILRRKDNYVRPLI